MNGQNEGFNGVLKYLKVENILVTVEEFNSSFGANNNKRRMVAAVQYLERVPVWSLLLALARPSPSSSYLQDK